MPSAINIIPDEISSFFRGNDFNFPPRIKPIAELIQVIVVNKIAAFAILTSYNANEIPAENASMLVAIPIRNKHKTPIQLGTIGLSLRDSRMMPIPIVINKTHTIIEVYGSIYDLTNVEDLYYYCKKQYDKVKKISH
jgi:hypothetical protein